MPDSEDNEADEVIVDQLRAEPLLVAVFLDGEYAIISKATRQLNPQNVLECLSCHSNKHKCKHISGYIDWAVDNSLPIQDLRITEETKTTSPRKEFRPVSTKVIPYPLTDKLKTKYDSIESGEYRWPDVLAPGLFQSCHHGNRVCEGDPIENGWIRCKTATIYRNRSASAQRTVCYRPTINSCCTVDFDGQDDLLFNLDHKNIFYHRFLFGYMHSFVESDGYSSCGLF